MHFPQYLAKYSELEVEIWDYRIVMRKLRAFIWCLNSYYFQLSPEGWGCNGNIAQQEFDCKMPEHDLAQPSTVHPASQGAFPKWETIQFLVPQKSFIQAIVLKISHAFKNIALQFKRENIKYVMMFKSSVMFDLIFPCSRTLSCAIPWGVKPYFHTVLKLHFKAC